VNNGQNEAFISSRKRSSGSLDETTPAMLTRKRASGSIDEDSAIFKEIEAMTKHPQPQQPVTPPNTGNPAYPQSLLMVADAGELFADCFKLSSEELLSSGGREMSTSSFLLPSLPDGRSFSTSSLASHTPSSSTGLTDQKDGLQGSPTGGMATSELYHALRDPARSNLSSKQIRAALSMLHQVPIESLSLRVIEDIVKTTSKNASEQRASLDGFLSNLESKELEVQEQFRKLDPDNIGNISLDTLRTAKAKGLLGNAEFLDMEDLQQKMDSLSVASLKHNGNTDRRIPFEQFRAMMLPSVPPAASIRTVMDLVRASLSDSMDVDIFSF